MHPDLKKIFDHFEGEDIAIFGSAVKDYDKAGDIDVIFPATVNYHDIMRRRGAQYRGGMDTPRGRVRRSTYRVKGVDKPIHLVQNTAVRSFKDHPHAILTRSGDVLNPGKFFDKEKWKRSKAGKGDPALLTALKSIQR